MPTAKLTADEIDHYLKLVAMLPMPGDAAEQLAARLRPWAEADDGKPTYVCVTVADNGHPGLRYVAGSSRARERRRLSPWGCPPVGRRPVPAATASR